MLWIFWAKIRPATIVKTVQLDQLSKNFPFRLHKSVQGVQKIHCTYVIWSDNGMIFVRAESGFTKFLKFKLNLPAALHHGESWQRLVWCCKQFFYALLENRKLTHEILETTSCLVEHSINARSLTSVKASPEGLKALICHPFLLKRQNTVFSLLSFEHFDQRN